jgi:chemotaxis protein CheD
MTRTNQPDLGGRPLHSIHIGGMSASRHPSVVRTVLGSCISVCLHDPLVQAGGMNNFMLPSGASGEAVSARYGVHAMELLINECMKAGADRRRLEAKVFGGGHVLRIRETDGNVPQINIKFALEFLQREAIPIISRDVGEYAAREVYFFTDSGRVCLKRLSATGGQDEQDFAALEREERASLRRPAAPPAPALDDSNVTLF